MNGVCFFFVNIWKYNCLEGKLCREYLLGVFILYIIFKLVFFFGKDSIEICGYNVFEMFIVVGVFWFCLLYRCYCFLLGLGSLSKEDDEGYENVFYEG